MSKIDNTECLNCTLPVHVCCGMPSKCRERYERYKVEMEKAKQKWSQPRIKPGRKKSAD